MFGAVFTPDCSLNCSRFLHNNLRISEHPYLYFENTIISNILDIFQIVGYNNIKSRFSKLRFERSETYVYRQRKGTGIFRIKIQRRKRSADCTLRQKARRKNRNPQTVLQGQASCVLRVPLMYRQAPTKIILRENAQRGYSRKTVYFAV